MSLPNECLQSPSVNDPEFLRRFAQGVFSRRVPISGSLDLTHRCNLRCVHCYLGSPDSPREGDRPELPTDRWLTVIDELAEAGCLYILLSGGEPLRREDFARIYRRLKSRGILVTVFSNGTLVDEPLLDLFAELPPQAVEISLYGATAATCDRITGVPGSYDRCLRGIQRLLERGFPVRLKTVLMSLNRHELVDLEAMARDLGVRFRFDAALFPRFDGDRAPLALRVSPEEAVVREFPDGESIARGRDYFKRCQDLGTAATLYLCSAGLTTFHIDPSGWLQPCLMMNLLRYDLAAGDFRAGWESVMPLIRARLAPKGYRCLACERRSLCGYCPAFFALESGSEAEPSDYLCRMGILRHRIIRDGIAAAPAPSSLTIK